MTSSLPKFLLIVCLCSSFRAFAAELPRKNFIDDYIFDKMAKDGVAPAPVTSDTEFLRRVYLDLTGRLPEPAVIRAFVKDTDRDKRNRAIDSLFPKLPTMGVGRRPTRVGPFLDRWSYFFSTLFRNNEQLAEGIDTFHNYIYKALELNLPYDQFVRDMITASGISTWTTGPANFVARHRIMEGDGYSKMNHEDTCDELALWTTKLFLGISTECISCHDGARHLEKISPWLAARKRAELWRQAAFFGKTYVAPQYGRIPEFMVADTAKGYDLSTKSAIRLPRNNADLTPTFMLTGEKYDSTKGETERQAYARMLTSHPQFARAAVNLFWAELMGRGIVDPVFGFDMLRQDPKNPPPAPWTIQPSHPELLNALADDFRKHNYDLRHLMKLITESTTYQLSSYYPGEWKPHYETYFARHEVQRLSAEQFWDAVSQATGIFDQYKLRYGDSKFNYIMQAHFSQDYASSHKALWNMLQDFGQTDREMMPSERSSMIQAASALNHDLILERVKIKPGSRLEKLLRAEPPKTNNEIVEDLFLATISRPPNAAEEKMAVGLIEKQRDQGAEDLLWALVNRLDFIFNY